MGWLKRALNERFIAAKNYKKGYEDAEGWKNVEIEDLIKRQRKEIDRLRKEQTQEIEDLRKAQKKEKRAWNEEKRKLAKMVQDIEEAGKERAYTVDRELEIIKNENRESEIILSMIERAHGENEKKSYRMKRLQKDDIKKSNRAAKLVDKFREAL